MTETIQPKAPAASARRHARPPTRWRARALPGTLAVTGLSTVVPGSGFLYAGRKVLGLSLVIPSLALAGWGAWRLSRDLSGALDVAFDPDRLTVVAVAAVALLVVWVANIVLTYLMVRPSERRRWQDAVGAAFVLLMSVAVAAPLVLAARYSLVQADLVTKVFEHNRSATAPVGVTKADPWGGRRRVNVLLLGGDGSIHRPGVRTDSVVLASMDVETGRTVLFSLPRNLMDVPFAPGSALAKLYPDGFRGDGDPSNWLLNAVYPVVPALHPGVLGHSDNEGADAVKLAVEGALDLPVDYYLLVNLAGFRSIVQAIGGVTVNINAPIPIGGNTDLGIPPDGYLQPGPNQRLNGFEALWFARGRYGSDDYQRMERQRCMIDAIVNEADPLNLLRRYQALAAVGKEIVRTDIPSTLLPAFVDLAGQVKEGGVRSVVFRSSAEFAPGNPDYEWMHAKVRRALHPPRHQHGATPDPTPTPSAGATPTQDPAAAVDANDSCAYRPAA